MFRMLKALLMWLRNQPKKLTIPAGALVLVLVAYGGIRGAQAYDYMENDPTFCRACHTMEKAWDRWNTSEHRSVNCHSCHEISIIQGAEQLIKFSLGQPEKVSKHARVPDNVCADCHESGDPRWEQVANTAGHRVHAEEQNIACIKCHAVSIHRFAPPKAICMVCHEDKHIEVAGMGEMHCLTCHQYLAGGNDLEPGRKVCLDCHSAQAQKTVTWPADAPMQYPCYQCHQPHEQAKPMVDCRSCHWEGSEKLHAKGAHSSTPCQTCHKPHEWVVSEREDCVSCHSDRADHMPGTFCGQCHKFN
jgi:nitrate/TMAO reductase-like tetraheme cytochrome c subunit